MHWNDQTPLSIPPSHLTLIFPLVFSILCFLSSSSHVMNISLWLAPIWSRYFLFPIYFSSSLFSILSCYIFCILSFFLFLWFFNILNLFSICSYTFRYRGMQIFLFQPNLFCLNICERNHENVNEEHDHSVHEMKMNEERDKIAHLFSSWYYIVSKKLLILFIFCCWKPTILFL